MRPLHWIVLVAIVASRPSLGVCDDLDAPDPTEVTRSKTYEYENTYFTIRLGGGLLMDYNGYDQDTASGAQLKLSNDSGIRDMRGLVSGRVYWPWLTYTTGIVFDAPTDKWLVRQTGLKIQIPQLNGFLFVGRTKEGFSTNKFMVGYYGWFNERSAANDAFLPILADGARWTATAVDGRFVYNVGAFGSHWSKNETFNKNDWQIPARLVWLPLGGSTTEGNGVLHLAVEGRYAGAEAGSLRYNAKPESFLAQSQVVDTGTFSASRSLMGGFEAYYVHGPLSMGTEYYINKVESTVAHDPFFHGGDAFVAYLFTGETHPYRPDGGFFDDVEPKHTFFSGGPGAWELALRGSYVDLDSQTISGGKFFRATALVNWYLTDNFRLEAAYGYGVLDRFDMTGNTQFFQTRLQLQVN